MSSQKKRSASDPGSQEQTSRIDRAKHGDARAQYLVGWDYHHGNNLPRDYGLARRYLEMAAQQDHPRALYYLGLCYLYGWLDEKNEATAIDYLSRAAKLGHMEALAKLQQELEEKKIEKAKFAEVAAAFEAIKKDQEKQARKALIDQANAGDPDAQYAVGLHYERGTDGFPINDRMAFKYFKMAADQEHIGALCKVGGYYKLAYNYGEALTTYLKASQLGSATGSYEAGVCYELGNPPNFSQALEHYELAAARGNGFAAERRRKLQAQLDQSVKTRDSAMQQEPQRLTFFAAPKHDPDLSIKQEIVAEDIADTKTQPEHKCDR